VNRIARDWNWMSPARHLALGIAFASLPATALAGVKVFETEGHTLELGMRLQQRLEYETAAPGTGGNTDARRDFLVRRARLKANGKMQGVSYGFEWKIDATDAANSTVTSAPATPAAGVENAWFQYPLRGAALEIRAGLYDQPFSRDRLTSDSQQLAVDRGEVSNVPDALGLADNVVGFHFLGRTKDSRVMYAVGLFDNRFIGAALQDNPMLVGRLDLNLDSTKDLYQDAHFGTDRWCSVGVNGSIQTGIENAAGADDSTHAAIGVDGMLDMPFGKQRVFVRGELSALRTEWHGSTRENHSTVKMLGAGVLFNERFQPFVRFDQVRSDALAPRGGDRDITYAGANWYLRGHRLKFQGDLRFQSGTGEAVDGARMQAQMDF
jgi:hypothetical protein